MADAKALLMRVQYPYDRFFDALERIFLLPFRHITNVLGLTKIQIVGDATDSSEAVFHGHAIITGKHPTDLRFYKTVLIKDHAYVERIMVLRGNSRILGTVGKILESEAPADVELELFGTVREALCFSGKLIAYPNAVMETVDVNTIDAEDCIFHGDLIVENGGIVRNATFADGTKAWYGNPDKPLVLIDCVYTPSGAPVVPELVPPFDADNFDGQPAADEVEEVELVESASSDTIVEPAVEDEPAAEVIEEAAPAATTIIEEPTSDVIEEPASSIIEEEGSDVIEDEPAATPQASPKAPAASGTNQELKLRRVLVVKEYVPTDGAATPVSPTSDGDVSHEATPPAGEEISEVGDEPIVEEPAAQASAPDSIVEDEAGHPELIGELDEPAAVSETASVESERPATTDVDDDELVIHAEVRLRGVPKGASVQGASVRVVDREAKAPLGEFVEEVEPVEVPEELMLAHNDINRTLQSIRENVMVICKRRDEMLRVYGDKNTKTLNDIKSVAGRAAKELETAEAFFEASMHEEVTLEQLGEILEQLNATAKTVCSLREKSREIQAIRRRTPVPTHRVEQPAPKPAAPASAKTSEASIVDTTPPPAAPTASDKAPTQAAPAQGQEQQSTSAQRIGRASPEIDRQVR